MYSKASIFCQNSGWNKHSRVRFEKNSGWNKNSSGWNKHSSARFGANARRFSGSAGVSKRIPTQIHTNSCRTQRSIVHVSKRTHDWVLLISNFNVKEIKRQKNVHKVGCNVPLSCYLCSQIYYSISWNHFNG